MNELNKQLFRDENLSEILDNNKKRAMHAVDEIPESQFLASTDEQIFIFELESSKFPHLEWFPERKEMSPRDVKVDVSNSPGYIVSESSHPALVHGFELTFEIPFQGSFGFWRLRPSEFGGNSPIGSYREGQQSGTGVLEIKYQYPADSMKPEVVKHELDQNIQKIDTYLERIRTDIDAYHKELEPIIRTAIEAEQKMGQEPNS